MVWGTVVVVVVVVVVWGTVVVVVEVVSPMMGGGAVVVVLSPVGDNFTIDETGNWLKRVVVVVSIEELDDTLFVTSLVICVFEIVSRVSEFPQ